MMALIPGLTREFRDLHIDGRFWPDSLGARALNADWAAVAKGVREGVVWECPEPLPDRIGDIDIKEAMEIIGKEGKEYKDELLKIAGDEKPKLEDQLAKMEKEWEARVQPIPM